MKKITSKQNRLNAKTVLALGVFLISALFVSQAQTQTVEIDVLPPDLSTLTPDPGDPVTMTSAEIDHPGGGSFKISYDVHLADGETMYVGSTGADPRRWGLSGGRFFIGDPGDKTENINNIQVTIIDDINGTLVGSDFTNLKFVGATVGQVSNAVDTGYFTYNGDEVNTDDFTKNSALSPFLFPSDVTSFNVGTTDINSFNNELGGNKWGVRSVKISVTYNLWTAGTQNFSDLQESGYKLYPNPASNNITVESEAGATITISSIVGASVLEISNATEVQQINTSSLAKGVYLVRVNNAVSKLIIE